MKRTFWRIRKFFQGVSPTKANRRTGLTSAGVAFAMVTAWGVESAASTIPVRLSITSEFTLLNARVLYGTNNSAGDFRSLGTIAGGTTTAFEHIVDDDFGSRTRTFAIVGAYDTGDQLGVTVSFPSDAPIQSHLAWETVFSDPRFVDESAILSDIISNGGLDEARRFLLVYGHPFYVGQGIIGVPFGETGTLINFSDATFGGTVTATIVPEPCSFVLVVSGMGVWYAFRRTRRG